MSSRERVEQDMKRTHRSCRSEAGATGLAARRRGTARTARHDGGGAWRSPGAGAQSSRGRTAPAPPLPSAGAAWGAGREQTPSLAVVWARDSEGCARTASRQAAGARGPGRASSPGAGSGHYAAGVDLPGPPGKRQQQLRVTGTARKFPDVPTTLASPPEPLCPWPWAPAPGPARWLTDLRHEPPFSPSPLTCHTDTTVPTRWSWCDHA